MPVLIGIIFLTLGILAATRAMAWWRGNEWRRAARRSQHADQGHTR